MAFSTELVEDITRDKGVENQLYNNARQIDYMSSKANLLLNSDLVAGTKLAAQQAYQGTADLMGSNISQQYRENGQQTMTGIQNQLTDEYLQSAYATHENTMSTLGDNLEAHQDMENSYWSGVAYDESQFKKIYDSAFTRLENLNANGLGFFDLSNQSEDALLMRERFGQYYNIENDTWDKAALEQSMYNADGTLNQLGKDFFDLMYSAEQESNIGFNIGSYSDWFTNNMNDDELSEWMLNKGYGANTLNQVLGGDADNNLGIYSAAERAFAMTDEQIDKRFENLKVTGDYSMTNNGLFSGNTGNFETYDEQTALKSIQEMSNNFKDIDSLFMQEINKFGIDAEALGFNEVMNDINTKIQDIVNIDEATLSSFRSIGETGESFMDGLQTAMLSVGETFFGWINSIMGRDYYHNTKAKADKIAKDAQAHQDELKAAMDKATTDGEKNKAIVQYVENTYNEFIDMFSDAVKELK